MPHTVYWVELYLGRLCVPAIGLSQHTITNYCKLKHISQAFLAFKRRTRKLKHVTTCHHLKEAENTGNSKPELINVSKSTEHRKNCIFKLNKEQIMDDTNESWKARAL